MKKTQQLEVFYDGSCPICKAEIDELREGDHQQILALIDCSADNFSPQGKGQVPGHAALMRALHVRDHGQWVAGPAAFARIYERMGMMRMARLWGSKALKPLVHLVYRLFVVARPLLAALGLARVVRWFVRRELRHRQRPADLDLPEKLRDSS